MTQTMILQFGYVKLHHQIIIVITIRAWLCRTFVISKHVFLLHILKNLQIRLWQVQYSTQDLDNLFCIPINKNELVENNERCVFSIQPLTSMYQYYLINDNTGDMWKFQWSTKGDDYRWIERFR